MKLSETQKKVIAGLHEGKVLKLREFKNKKKDCSLINRENESLFLNVSIPTYKWLIKNHLIVPNNLRMMLDGGFAKTYVLRSDHELIDKWEKEFLN
jgi:hypothetical protein